MQSTLLVAAPAVQQQMLARLAAAYPDARPELNAVNAYECMVATVLAAQCTDKRVNQVTPALFAAYPDPQAMAAATPEQIIPYIKSCGFFNAKANHIVAACRKIVEEYDGRVPGQLQQLRTLPGVGQKTANVIYANAFGGDAIAVDTHVFRVANRTGLADAPTPEKTEAQLRQVIPQHDWSAAHHWILLHGRRVCHARKPDCANCTLHGLCLQKNLK